MFSRLTIVFCPTIAAKTPAPSAGSWSSSATALNKVVIYFSFNFLLRKNHCGTGREQLRKLPDI